LRERQWHDLLKITDDGCQQIIHDGGGTKFAIS